MQDKTYQHHVLFNHFLILNWPMRLHSFLVVSYPSLLIFLCLMMQNFSIYKYWKVSGFSPFSFLYLSQILSQFHSASWFEIPNFVFSSDLFPEFQACISYPGSPIWMYRRHTKLAMYQIKLLLPYLLPPPPLVFFISVNYSSSH